MASRDGPGEQCVHVRSEYNNMLSQTDMDYVMSADDAIRALLNELTTERFDSISDQIIAWANNSKKEKDGRTLILVTRRIYEMATRRDTHSEMYARLCRKLTESISPEVQDYATRDPQGKPIAGGNLFRKYLLNRCQDGFERGWVTKEIAATIAVAKASDDQAVKAASEKSLDDHIAQKASQQGPGLIKFIGELFKLQMFTEQIMHDCIKKLLANLENPKEEEIESLCQLLKTVGQLLDVPKARAHMDVYFTRMKVLSQSLDRMQLMLQDVIGLRDRKWVACGAIMTPTTISAVYETAAKERAATEAQSLQRIAMSRGGWRRGSDRAAESRPGPDGWTMAGGSVARSQPEAGDLSQSSTISKPASPVSGDEPEQGVLMSEADARRKIVEHAKKLTSEERYLLSLTTRSASVSSSPAAMQFRLVMTRTASQGGPGNSMGNRTRSKSGDRRTDANKVALYQQGDELGFGALGGVPILGAALEPVAPLEISANRWVATSTVRKPDPTETSESPEIVDRKVRSLLNKLTMEKFDSISDQIIAWANKSEKEKDGRTLVQVINLVFEKATDEGAWNEMYARLCRKMMETITPEVQDDGIRNPEGKPIAGAQLFRKYLLNRCQEGFERGWVAKETTAATAAVKASGDQAIKAANEKKGDENELYSDEYHAAQKAKRQGLGLIKFIGELFKLQMLTERIMHECVKKLLGNVENPKEEEIESLCQLLKTVGQLLDVPKARAHMDVYFTRMKELAKSLDVSPGMQLILQDVIELRDRKWVARGAIITPTTISAVHEAAAKEKAAAEAQSLQRIAMSRGGSRRGDDQTADSGPGPDGWTTAGGSVARSQPKAGDLSQFGKISKPASMVIGPSSTVFTKKDTKRDSLSQTSSNSSMFSMLSQNAEQFVDVIPRPSRPSSRKPSVDFGQRERQKLSNVRSYSFFFGPSPVQPPTKRFLPLQKKIDEDAKEFFAVRNLDEADVYFTNLPEEHRYRLVDKLVASALESKESDAVLVSDFFTQASSKGQCSSEVFESGFMPMAELLDDIAIDAPNAFKFMAVMLKGAGLDQDKERLGRIAGKSMDGDKLLQLLS